MPEATFFSGLREEGAPRSVRRVTRELLLKELLPAAQSRLPAEPIQLWGEVVELRRFAPQVCLRDKKIGEWRIWVSLPTPAIEQLEVGDMVGIEGMLVLEAKKNDSALLLWLEGRTIERVRGLKSRRVNCQERAIETLAMSFLAPPRLTKRLRQIAIISSYGSLGLADFQKLLGEKVEYGLRQNVFDVRLGDARSIADGIARAGRGDADLVVIIRGGGPKWDLEPFNDVVVAEALVALNKPAMIGIGHSQDRPAAYRFVGYSADTPSHAAAEVVKLFYESKHIRAERSEDGRSAIEPSKCIEVAPMQIDAHRAGVSGSSRSKLWDRFRGSFAGAARLLRAFMIRLVRWAFLFGLFAAGWKGAPYWDKLAGSPAATFGSSPVGNFSPVSSKLQEPAQKVGKEQLRPPKAPRSPSPSPPVTAPPAGASR